MHTTSNDNCNAISSALLHHNARHFPPGLAFSPGPETKQSLITTTTRSKRIGTIPRGASRYVANQPDGPSAA